MISWQPNLSAALDRARQERRFVLADFSKDRSLPQSAAG